MLIVLFVNRTTKARSLILECAKYILLLILTAVLTISSPAAVVTGTNTGAIPEGADPNPTCGAPRDINFAVSGASTPVASVSLSITINHSYIGDLDVSLIAPDFTVFTLFSFVGRTPPVGSDFGDSSNLNGTYVFSDISPGNIWSAAAGGGNGFNIPAGGFLSQMPGPFSPKDPGPSFTSLNSAFLGVVNPNGDWTLRVLDCAAQDTGTVSAATLTLLGPTAAGLRLAGRVMSPTGRGLSKVFVSVSGGNLNETRIVPTNQFGYFAFDDLQAGLSYVVTVSSKKYAFSNPTQIVNLGDDFGEMNFIAEL